MNATHRIIDANINRTSEGLRVLEDLARYKFESTTLTENIKKLRHQVRKTIAAHSPKFLMARDSQNDVGFEISNKTDLDKKNTTAELVQANFKRVQEGLRVIEESLKIIDHYDTSKKYESFRYLTYSLEKDYLGTHYQWTRRDLLNTDLYCLTSEEHSKGKNNIEVVKQMIAAGIKLIQYREKEKHLLEKYNECSAIRMLTADTDVTFLINDDVDLAMMVEADGVHIGQEDWPIEAVRKIIGEEMIIGVSTHSPKQAEDAIGRGADYIGIGPIFRTFTKKDVCDPVGFEYLDYAARNVDIPFVAIGGIKENNVSSVIQHGAKCVALVTEIVGADNIEDKISRLRKEMEQSKEIEANTVSSCFS